MPISDNHCTKLATLLCNLPSRRLKLLMLTVLETILTHLSIVHYNQIHRRRLFRKPFSLGRTTRPIRNRFPRRRSENETSRKYPREQNILRHTHGRHVIIYIGSPERMSNRKWREAVDATVADCKSLVSS